MILLALVLILILCMTATTFLTHIYVCIYAKYLINAYICDLLFFFFFFWAISCLLMLPSLQKAFLKFYQ